MGINVILPPNNAVLGIVGLILSAYSVHVERMVAHREDEDDDGGGMGGEGGYVALCDIESIGASCSAVFSLPEGKMLSFFGLVPSGHVLDVPNGVLGMLFYAYTIVGYFIVAKGKQRKHQGVIFSLFSSSIVLVISSLALASSVFLGMKLYEIRELCVVCVSTHVINATLWIRAMMEFGNARHRAKIN